MEMFGINKQHWIASDLANKIRGKYRINSQAVRLRTSGAPDTRALSAMMQFNSLNKFKLEDVDAHLDNEEMAEIFANLFREDSLEYDLVLSSNGKVIKEEIWSQQTNKLILKKGKNIFWLDNVDNMNISVMGKSHVPSILKSTPLDKTSFQKILQDKINGYNQRIKVLKVLDTSEATNEINSIISEFQKYEQEITGSASNPNSITSIMKKLVNQDLNACSNDEKAQFIQSLEGINEDTQLDPRFTKIDPLDFYDIIIKATNFEDLSDPQIGWSILKSQDAINNYDQLVKAPIPIIGVVGVGNRGKSYILSKVSGFTLPEGYSVETQGFSLKYLNEEGKNLILLDSAGTSTPLTETNKFKLDNVEDLEVGRKQIEAVSRDKSIMEMFLQQFVITHSQIILAVVGQMTYNEQKLLSRLRRFTSKRLIVVHNLMNFRTRKQVEFYIEHTLKKMLTLNLKENHFVKFNENDPVERNLLYFNEQFERNNKNISIDHIILGSDLNETETKEYYNESGFRFLKKLLESETKPKPFDVVDKVRKYIGKCSNDFMEEEIKPDEHVFVENDKIIVKNTELKLKKILFSEMGESSFLGSGYEPKYGVWLQDDNNNAKRKKLVIEVEVVGQNKGIKSSFRNVEDYILFHIKGEKEVPNVDGEMLIENKLKNEKFDFRIKIKRVGQIDKESLKITPLTSVPKGKDASSNPIFNGIYQITYMIDMDDNDEEAQELEL